MHPNERRRDVRIRLSYPSTAKEKLNLCYNRGDHKEPSIFMSTWDVFTHSDLALVVAAGVGFMAVVTVIPYVFASTDKRERSIKYRKENK